MTYRARRWALPTFTHHLRTLLEHDLRVCREQSDQLLAIDGGHGWPLERALTHEVGLALANGPGEPGIIRGHRAIGLLPHDDVALFGAEYVHGFGALRCD